MKSAAKRRAGRPALELIESAVHLLRGAPAGALLAYYVGSVPCLLGLLYFWADMARGAYARDHLIEASLGAAGLYLWMKCWHTVFAARLRAHLQLERDVPWTLGRVFHMVLIQAAVQPLGLFVRPIAAQILLPYVWCYSFFQNVGVLGDGTRESFREVTREAGRQAGLWSKQAHLALLVIFGFMFFVWLNIGVLLWLAPKIIKSGFGVETVFSRNPWAILNSTTFAASLAATYLCADPIRKALYVLRCFHGASLQSGADLRVELKALQQSARSAVAVLVLVGLMLGGALAPLRAAETTPAAVPAPAPRVEATELSGSLDRVLQQREYAWRMPREKTANEEAKQSWFANFFEGLWKKLTQMVKQAMKWIGKVYDWLRKIFDREPKPQEDRPKGNFDWSSTARWTLIVLGAVLFLILGVLIWRWRKNFQGQVLVAQPVAAMPDLNEENVTADQLPEDGWLQLARELMARGELRLALRAYYLAGLAHLGQREFLLLARHKSNRDYDRELRRRARGNAELLTAFDANLLTFEAAWYGEHLVTTDTLGGFSENLERIRAC